MSFIENLFTYVETLGTKQFKNDEICIEVNENTRVFFANLRPNEFTSFNFATRRSWGGLKIIKTDYNSLNDSVNPQFLNALKKSVKQYWNILAAAEWKECTKEESEIPKKIYIIGQIPECLFYIHKFENMGDVHSILSRITMTNNFKILVMGTSSGILIGGKEKNLTSFFNFLKEESMKFKSSGF